MPRTITDVYSVYTFDELTPEVQEKVIERFGQQNHEFFDVDELTSQFAEKLQEWGFPHDKTEWSLGHCQGDGVAFYGTIDVGTYIRKIKQTKLLRLLDPSRNLEVDVSIVRNSWGNHYSHWNTMDVEFSVEHDERSLTPVEVHLATLLEESIKEHVVEVSKQLEKDGYAELESVTTREYIVEQIEANEYEFKQGGELYG